MKKIICLILSVLLIIPSFSAFAETPWGFSDDYYKKYPMQFMPKDNYYSYQNGPSFTWPIVYGATYDLKVCSDKELNDVKYFANDLKYNLYTFPVTFEKGRDYYWSVRYKKGGKESKWQDGRRFYIDTNAYDFVLQPMDDIGKNLKSHPRFYSKEDLEVISKIDQSNEEFKNLKSTIDAFVDKGEYSKINIVEESWGKNSWSYKDPANDFLQASMMYLVTKDKKYVDYIIKGFEKHKDLDPKKIFEWGVNSDREECVFAYKAAIAYDIVYNFMTDAERKNAVALIERNLERPFEHHGKNGKIDESLYAKPFGSHEYRLDQALVAGIAIYNESKLARELVDFHLPLFATLMYPFAYQDGSSGQGPFYGLPTELVSVVLYLERAGVVDCLNKAYIRNLTTAYLYLWPPNWILSIGDSYNQTPEATFQCALTYLYLSSNDSSKLYREYSKWMLSKILGNETQYYFDKFPEFVPFNANQDTLITQPDILPNAMYFPDCDWIAMYSDLKDDNRIGMTFKSSFFGSHNHSHPDQNSFVIEAYGKELLIDSDYYDYYHSPFDINWNKKTYAHNAITYNKGMGQPRNNINAKGKVTDFVNQKRYKLASGDATDAYMGGLTKAKRDIIYIYPETFIVIDDLANKKPTSYEYFLNTRGDIEFYRGKNGAKITNEDAMMEVFVHYPKKVKSNYIDYFAGPDLVKTEPPAEARNATDKRLYFATDNLEQTKIVTTLDVHKKDDKARYVKKEEHKDYLKLIFETGDICYINISDKENIKTKDGIEFDGLALIYNKDNLMLTKGKKVIIDNKEIINSDSVISLSVGRHDVSFSSIDKEANVHILYDKPKNVIKQDKENFVEIEENKEKNGVLWNYKDNYLNFNLFPGTYSIFLDKELIPGKEGKGKLKIFIDGVETNIPYSGIYDINNNLTKDITIKGMDGIYFIEDYNNISVKNMKKNDIFILNSSTSFYIKGDNPYINLKTIKQQKYPNVIIDEPKDIEKNVDCKVRATDYKEGGKGSTVVYWERIENDTLQSLNSPLMDITYEFDVKEKGKYDIIMSVSTVSLTTSDKVFNLNGNMGIFNIPKTEKYSDLQAVRVKTGIELNKGKATLKLTNIDNGQCIYDWIGLIRSDK